MSLKEAVKKQYAELGLVFNEKDFPDDNEDPLAAVLSKEKIDWLNVESKKAEAVNQISNEFYLLAAVNKQREEAGLPPLVTLE